MIKKEFKWVNTLKGIGIIFVVIGHTATPMSRFIFSWHMPLFFFISGFFLIDVKDYKLELKKNFKRLMYPYFIFGLIGIVVEIIKRFLLSRAPIDYDQMAMGLLVRMDSKGLEGHYGFVLWFLPALFVAKAIIQFLQYKKINEYMIFSIGIGLFFTSFMIDLPFAIDNGFNNILWVFMGSFFFNKTKKINFGQYKILIPCLFIITLYSLSSFSFPGLDIAKKEYEWIPFNISWSMFMIFVCVSFSQINFLKTNLFDFLSIGGKYSLITYLLHPYTNNLAYILAGNISWIVVNIITFIFLIVLVKIRISLSEWKVVKYV